MIYQRLCTLPSWLQMADYGVCVAAELDMNSPAGGALLPGHCTHLQPGCGCQLLTVWHPRPDRRRDAAGRPSETACAPSCPMCCCWWQWRLCAAHMVSVCPPVRTGTVGSDGLLLYVQRHDRAGACSRHAFNGVGRTSLRGDRWAPPTQQGAHVLHVVHLQRYSITSVRLCM